MSEAQHFENWSAASAGWRWRNFTPREMACRGSDTLLLVPSFMDRIQALRDMLARPLVVTSGYRSPAHNTAVGGAPASMHLQGRAVDVRVTGTEAWPVMSAAVPLGFRGLGLRLHAGGTMLHLDDRDGPVVMWTYA